MKLDDLLQRKAQYLEDKIISTYANGFELTTDTLMSSDPNRVLPIGGPQDAILNYIAHHPELVIDKNVFEPFSGSGVFGLMSLKMGAKSVDLLDINQYAVDRQLENAANNNLKNNKLRCIMGDINNYSPDKHYDLILANPPFVATPKKVKGTIHSNGGYDGNALCIPLIKNISNWLSPNGEALIYMSQLMVSGVPSLSDVLSKEVKSREIEITIIQKESDSLENVFKAYKELFSLDIDSIEQWKSELHRDYGEDLSFNNCIIHIKPMSEAVTSIVKHYNIDEKYGLGSLDQYPVQEITKSRIRENIL